mmetsp:Transcript_29864/g.71101  ORF Transcript_29864/g.71101 Transcript_29864/m.71101 type:complete len:227 (+) Transcript_29864:38-718(+)
MLKSGSYSAAMPSNVTKVRVMRTTYSGVSIKYLVESRFRAAAMSPNRVCAFLSEPTSSPKACTNSSKVLSTQYGRVLLGRRFFFTGLGTNSTTCMEQASAVQFLETTLRMPSAKPSMTLGDTRSMSPKSRKQMRPSCMYLRLPSWGSACTKPVMRSCTRQASAAKRTARCRRRSGKSLKSMPSAHSVLSTRQVPLGPVYFRTQAGAVTKPSHMCSLTKSSMFRPSL